MRRTISMAVALAALLALGGCACLPGQDATATLRPPADEPGQARSDPALKRI
jgi:hypothetical protein